MERITCLYCKTVNSPADETCLACGAPLERAPLSSARPAGPPPAAATGFGAAPAPDLTLDDLRKTGEQVEDVYHKALGVYALGWRTLGEVLSIALTASFLGLLAAVSGLAGWGILAALLVGLTVGLVAKNFWLTLLGAPGGAVAGAGVGLVLWAVGLGPGALFGAAWAGAEVGALLGRYRSYDRRNLWERLRPVLGVLGGLFFGLLGVALGAGLVQVAAALGVR